MSLERSRKRSLWDSPEWVVLEVLVALVVPEALAVPVAQAVLEALVVPATIPQMTRSFLALSK
jgi:hypothetical protein